MYFWKYRELAITLSDNAVVTKQYYIYLVIFWIEALLSVPSMLSQPLLWTVIVALWIGISFTVNNRGDGRDYFKRLICLDLPITIRALAIFLPLGIIFSIAYGIYQHAQGMSLDAAREDFNSSFTPLIIPALSLIYYIALFVKGFQIASGQAKA